MRILGLDASTRVTGYGVMNRKGKLLAHGVIDLHNRKESVEERIAEMVVELDALIDRVAPDVIYIEEMWNKMNISTTKSLSYVIGAVIGFGAVREVPVELLLPSVWRSRIGLSIGKKKRAELKAEAMAFVKERYGLDVSDDEAEGICIAYAGTLMDDEDEELFG